MDTDETSGCSDHNNSLAAWGGEGVLRSTAFRKEQLLVLDAPKGMSWLSAHQVTDLKRVSARKYFDTMSRRCDYRC